MAEDYNNLALPIKKTYEDSEIDNLEEEVKVAEERIQKQRRIKQLEQNKAQINKQSKELFKNKGRFNFGNKDPKFWIVAAVVSIFGAVILFKIIQKFI